MELIEEFQKLLGADEIYSDFRVEGITILIPFSIGEHRDLMNCSEDGMDTVIGIHVKLALSILNPNDESDMELRDFLKLCGYNVTFPCAVILYSRKVCHAHALKMTKVIQCSREDTLRQVVFWALTKRVGHVVDYNHFVFDNNSFLEYFEKEATVRKESRFNGHALRRVASYDKMVSRVLMNLKN